jgi:hypothetical protein
MREKAFNHTGQHHAFQDLGRFFHLKALLVDPMPFSFPGPGDPDLKAIAWWSVERSCS